VFDVGDEQVLTLALAENLHRHQLSNQERVQALCVLAAVHQPGRQLGGQAGPQPGSTDELCRRLGVSRHTMHRWLALSHQSKLLEAVESGHLDFTAAGLIATAPADQQPTLQEEQMTSPMPSRQLAERVLQLRSNERLSAAMTLQHVLRSLQHVDCLRTDAERDLVEQIEREAERLLAHPAPSAKCASGCTCRSSSGGISRFSVTGVISVATVTGDPTPSPEALDSRVTLKMP
jgi:ParB-like chromosome segregation protein Spo0J